MQGSAITHHRSRNPSTQSCLEFAWRACLLSILLVAFLLTAGGLYTSVLSLIEGAYASAPLQFMGSIALGIATTLLWAYRDEIVSA
jgi:hypothetical protein